VTQASVEHSVLDASAVLAFAYREPGSELVHSLLGGARVSTVNWIEVVQKCLEDGIDIAALRDALEAAGATIVPLQIDQAEIAGQLRHQTRQFGLSLGDRACLALAMVMSLSAVTADRVWQRLVLPIPVRVIR
jgi:PIN domain nuclease of toxin-antitoxin system